MDYFREAQAVRLRSPSKDHRSLQAYDGDDKWLSLDYNKAVARCESDTIASEHEQAIMSDEEFRDTIASEHEQTIMSDERFRDTIASEHEQTIMSDEKTRRSLWFVEFVANSDSVLRLKSCYGKYLAASYKRPCQGMTGCLVIQSHHPDLYSEWQPMMEGSHVKLCTHYGTFLSSREAPPITHDLPDNNLPDYTIWDVEVVNRKEEGSATNIDDKASEEGSASNIDDKASSAIKRHHKTGEGSSVTKSPSGESDVKLEGDRIRCRHHFWELKRRLLDPSRTEDMLVRGGSGTTALIREVCADVSAHFGTIAWISIPKNNHSALIHEEIFLQLIFEMVAFSTDFDTKTWLLTDHGFSLPQGCLIVVDNLDDPKTLKKFKEILIIVKRCRAIFIAEHGMDSSYSQIKELGREFELYELKGLCYLEEAQYLENFLEKDLPFPYKFPEKDFPRRSKQLFELIVSKCKRLTTAIVCVLRDQDEQTRCSLYDLMGDEWEVRIPLDNLYHEFHVILQMLNALKTPCFYKDKGLDEPDPLQQVLQILHSPEFPLCLLYLSMFPENRLLSRKTVYRLWAAEGLLTDLGRAEHFFKVLLSRNCIRSVEERNGVLSTFQVDKSVREIIVSLSHLCDPVIKTSQGSKKWPVWITYLSVRGTIGALNRKKTLPLSSIFVLGVSSDGDKLTAPESSDGETSLPEVSNAPLSDLKHSKVLDLTGVRFQIVPDVLFGLTAVRYLSLRNSSIKAIPHSIEKLTRLEFLDAKHSLVTRLPQQVARLKKIRHILIYHHKRDPLMESYNLMGFKALCRIGGFKDLEELCFVEADERTLIDLGNLTKLRRLGITKLRKEHGESLCASLGKLKVLMSLNLHALDEDEILDLQWQTSSAESESQTSSAESESQTSPPEFLKHLYLHGRLEKLPDWISCPNKLTKIVLRWSQLEVDLLSTLGKLPELVELELRRAYDGEKLDFTKRQFPKLETLLLEELEGLRSMSLEKGTMPRLKNLTICRCQWLKRVPDGIGDIVIQKLTFFDMSHEFYEKVRKEQEKDNYRIFQSISGVYFRRWRAGHWETHQVDSTDEEVESTDGIRLENFYSFK